MNNQPLDPESVRAAVRADYEVVRQIARDRGLSVASAGALVDAEVDRLTRNHVAGMPADQAAEFIQIYNAEYNRLVMARLQNRKGCASAVVIIVSVASALLCTALAAMP